MILLLCLVSGPGCTATDPIVLPSDAQIYVVRSGHPEFDGTPADWADLEGWFVISPGQVLHYLRWLSDEKARARAAEISDE